MSENNVQKEKPQQNIGELLKIRRDKLAELQNEGENPFALTSYDQDTHTADIIDNFDNMDGKTVSIAGRLMSKRVMGKASFFERASCSFTLPVTSWARSRTRSLKSWTSAT